MKPAETEEDILELKQRLGISKFKPIESPIKFSWKNKDGNKLNYKQFMERWKNGIRGITPYQQTKMQLNSTYIMLIGILCGFVITFFNLKNLWWLTIILGAALFNTGVSALGLWQKKVALEDMEKVFQEIE